ncbi:hypothetical protein [Tuwongella immobilis]|uniref:hypothetical protein n=1 Tax=Tuwongella immobilis TaxID=692036 RepID=UPI001E572BB3|nr:hypothetical protein [Tuwongella immobilis]
MREVLSGANRLTGTVQSVQGVLMANNQRPFLGDSLDDWVAGQCIYLRHDGLLDLLLETLLPYVIGGGRTLFLYPAVAIGRIEWDHANGDCSISDIRSITVDVHGEQFILNLASPHSSFES